METDGALVAINDTIAKSICTHYSKISGRPDIFLGSGTFKKLGTLLFEKSKVPDLLKVPDPKKISGRSDKLE